MEETRFLFSVAVLLGHCLMVCLAKTVHNITTDQSALLALKAHVTVPPHGLLANNWSTATSICSWAGVTCDNRRQRVTALNISNMGLRGGIPPHLGNLSFLVWLDMNGNFLRGPLPNELVHLHRLKFMNLKFNNLTGELPPGLGALSQLQELHLGYNLFTGTIPPSISNISKLEALNLHSNSLQGKIPEEMGNLQNLKLLDLQSNRLVGFVPFTIFNISSLQSIGLSDNSLSGSLPADICHRLPKLERLMLSYNELEGQIASGLYECSQLQILSLSYNNFNGPIPREIGNLTMLQQVAIGGNNLKGEVPQEIGNLGSLWLLGIESAGLTGPLPSSIYNLTSLMVLYLPTNNLTGVIPQEIGGLGSLWSLVLDSNNLRGHIPETLFNISTLLEISLVDNHFSGNLPSSISHTLPNLEQLYLGLNNLDGIILDSLSNVSSLVILDIANNKFTGSIPNSLSNLGLLQILNLETNNFNSESPFLELGFLIRLENCRNLVELRIDDNPLGGILPISIGNLSTSLQIFSASNSGIKGNIPSGIGNLSNLVSLYLHGNDLRGIIPTTFKGLQNLQRLHLENNIIEGSIPEDLCHLLNMGELDLSENTLSGSVPACLGNVTSLRYLYLGSNMLTSTIPASLWSLKDLLNLNLSSNSLSGYLAPEIESLKVVNLLDLSINQFTGNIPSTIGGLQYLVNLSLAHNCLQGPIPESFKGLLSLELLDLSHNKLSGGLPKSLETLQHLKYFNVSFNELSGEIPSGGPFAKFTSQSFMSNNALCGASRFQVIPCATGSLHNSRRKRKVLLVIYIWLPIASVLVALTFAFVCLRCQKRNKNSIQIELVPGTAHVRIAHHELLRATDGFSESKLLGIGSFGSVYKGVLTDGTILAIKIFNLQHEGAFKSFDTECEILRNIRHRNLTKVISSCSNLEFKALILEYMRNGSLEKWLHSDSNFLDILQRLDIMIDVACALDYLHNGCSPPVVHCDLKPSNVLLDENMVAHVSDFGIAKLLSEGESVAITSTLATFGYIAPEYGLEGLVSTKCDIYSYGIMLMETFTRRRPTDEMFSEHLSLRDWVNEALSDAIVKVMDSNLLRPEEQYFTAKVQCVSSALELALKCSAESPQERINMKDALAALKKTRAQFMDNRTTSNIKA